jgi:hypothetical protein
MASAAPCPLELQKNYGSSVFQRCPDLATPRIFRPRQPKKIFFEESDRPMLALLESGGTGTQVGDSR